MLKSGHRRALHEAQRVSPPPLLKLYILSASNVRNSRNGPCRLSGAALDSSPLGGGLAVATPAAARDWTHLSDKPACSRGQW